MFGTHESRAAMPEIIALTDNDAIFVDARFRIPFGNVCNYGASPSRDPREQAVILADNLFDASQLSGQTAVPDEPPDTVRRNPPLDSAFTRTSTLKFSGSSTRFRFAEVGVARPLQFCQP